MRRTVLASVTATRYVLPLREGGSLPGLMEADDLGTYVVKWRSAGQGVPVLVAEVVCGELARALALPVPALVTVEVAPELAVGEPDQEVQELLRHSAGTNLGMDYLPGALDFSHRSTEVDPGLAGRVLWFDALVGNVDRSWRNPNMLIWHGRLQLIDHGAALTFHHHWPGAQAAVDRPYDATQHALVESQPDVAGADAALAPLVTRPLLEEVLAQVPDAWLRGPSPGDPADVVRARYVAQVLARLDARPSWLPGLIEAAADGSRGRAPEPRGQNRPGWLGPPPPPGVSQR